MTMNQLASEKESLTCKLCGEKPVDLQDFNSHLMLHIQNQSNIKCYFCRKLFKKDRYLREHIRKYHRPTKTDKQLKCIVCYKDFHTMTNLCRHVKIMHNTADRVKHKCNFCDKTFLWPSSLSYHKRQVHHIAPPLLKATVIESDTNTIQDQPVPLLNLEQLIQTACTSTVQNDEKPMIVPSDDELEVLFVSTNITTQTQSPDDTCTSTGTSKSNEEATIKKGTGHYKCALCSNECFQSLVALKKHIRVQHLGGKPYSCSYCYVRFAHTSALLKHRREEHSQQHGPNMWCNICKSKFVSLEMLKDHVKNHLGVPYNCICSMGFAKIKQLEKHFAKNVCCQSGVKKCYCNLCEDKFEHLSDLKLHVFKHLGGQTYKCVCRLTFESASQIQAHIDECHSKPFHCSLCNKPFDSYSDIFKSHMSTHCGHSPYSCSSCNKRFSFPKMLEIHILSEH